MNLKSECGLTLVELLVVVGVLACLLSTCIRPLSYSALQQSTAAVGIRGRDLYVALTSANAEREALGLPPLWPRDSSSGTDTNGLVAVQSDFTNSTDYFLWLLGDRNSDAPEREPLVKGLYTGALAGAGVPPCYGGHRLSASNNLWTIAKNVRGDMDDAVPVLITRNIDASSLAARVAEQDFETKALRFDPAWKTPFGNKGFVLIRKGGGIFTARPKNMTWGVVYQNQTFDTARTPDGRAAPPLKYLTPDREVVPGG